MATIAEMSARVDVVQGEVARVGVLVAELKAQVAAAPSVASQADLDAIDAKVAKVQVALSGLV